MHGSMIVECPPGAYAAERQYAIEVVLGEFLGLDYRLVVAERADMRLRREGDAGELLLPEVLFRVPECDWLTPRALPARPLARWCPPHWLTELHAVSSTLPVLYGQPAGEGYYQEAVHPDGPSVRLGLDVFGSAFFMLTRYEELAHPVRDKHGRFPALASLAWQEGFLERPIVNEYVEILWAAMKRLWPGLSRTSRRYRLQLSHDVDLPIFSCPRQLLKTSWADLVRRRNPALALSRLGSFANACRGHREHDPFNTFDFLMDHSERLGLQSSFYFIASRTGGRLDGYYQLEDPWIVALMRAMHQRGHELGLHPSYHTYRDPSQTAREFSRLRALTEREGLAQERWGGRQHYLRWENPITWQNWEEAGLDYDSTLSFADHVGFRCGTCYEFPVFNLRARRRLRLIEVPLTAMDITLTVYMGLNLSQAVEKLLGISRLCRMFSGSFVLLWHNSSLLLPEQKYWYVTALEELSSSGAWYGSHKAS